MNGRSSNSVTWAVIGESHMGARNFFAMRPINELEEAVFMGERLCFAEILWICEPWPPGRTRTSRARYSIVRAPNILPAGIFGQLYICLGVLYSVCPTMSVDLRGELLLSSRKDQ